MAETLDKLATQKNTFLVVIITLAIAAGIPLTEYTFQEFFTNELDNSFYCTADIGERYAGEIMEFNKLSPSEHRGYPYEGTTKGYKDCGDDDKWVGLIEYSELLGINPYDFIEEQTQELEEQEPEPQPKEPRKTSRAKQEICNVDGTCIEVINS